MFPLLAEVGGETVAKQLRTPHSGDADRNQIQRLRIEIEGLRERVQGVEQRLTDAMATIGDLRAERDQLLGMIETQAKHQPATRRKWWPWG